MTARGRCSSGGGGGDETHARTMIMKTVGLVLVLLILGVSTSTGEDQPSFSDSATPSFTRAEGVGGGGQEGYGGEQQQQEEVLEDDNTQRQQSPAEGELSAAARLPQPSALQGNHRGVAGGTHHQHHHGQHHLRQPLQQGLHLNTRIPPSCALCSTERNLCRIISGIFTRSPLPYGYSLVTPVPAGVCNLTITEMKPSKNFFALRRSDGTYVLNGNWDIEAGGQYQAGGTTFLYTPGTEDRGEQLSAPGPLTHPIDFMLISQSPNPGIKYEYRVPLPEYLGGSSPSVGIPSTGLQPSTGLTSPSGGVRPNIGSVTGSSSNIGRSGILPGPSHVGPFQPIPQGNTNLGTRNPNFNIRNPAPSGVSTGGSGLYPNLDGGSFAPLTPVMQPVGLPGQGSAFNSSLPFSSISPQGVGTTNLGPSRRNPAYPRIPLVPSTGQNSGGSAGLPRVNTRTQSLTPLANPNSPSLPVPWNPAYGTQDGSHLGVPLGTPYHSGQQYPRGSAVLPSSGTGYPSTRFTSQGRTTGESRSEVGGHSRTTHPGTPGVRQPSIGSPGHHRHAHGRASTPATPTAHRTRHHHGSKGMQGQRKVHGKTPEFSSFDPGVQLTQPKVISSALANQTSSRRGRQRGSKTGRRRHRHEDREKRRRKDRGQRKGGRSRFQWAEKGLTPCSKTCGGGNQTAIMSCEKKRNKKVVPDRRCSHLQRPEARVVLCNLTPCPASWMPGDWGACSVTCGMGVQTRPLMCKQVVSPTLTMMVPEGACLSPPEVPTSQVCELRPCNLGPAWEIGSWANCSAPCGLGTRGRQVSCVVAGVPVGESRCDDDTKPIAEEVCDMGSCATHVWFVSDWSNQCSESCGPGMQTRRVHCLGGGDQGLCPAISRPEATRPCLGESTCGGQWFTGFWGECSRSCGGGQATRGVACVVLTRGKWKVTQETQCHPQDRPQDTRDCNMQPCTPQWFTSDWTQCSASCEGGVMRREVTCLDTSLRPSPECLNTTRPASHQTCHDHPCTVNPVQPTSLPHPLPRPDEDGDEQATLHNEDAVFEETTDVTYSDADTEDRGSSTDETEVSIDNEENDEAETVGEELENDLVVEETTGSALNVIPDKDAQGDESVSSAEEEGLEEEEDREEEEKKKKKRKRKKDRQKNREEQSNNNNSTEHSKTEKTTTENISCIDRIKNCHLVFRARLCRLRYYNKLCCRTCSSA